MYSVEDLSAFVSIVKEGSVTGAAKAMDLDPATVSRRLSKLEAKLNVSLIKRSTRRMAITAKGRLFHSHAVAAIRLLRQAEQSVASTEQDASLANIVIAGPGWLLQRFLVPTLQKINAAHSAALELITADSSDILADQATINISVGQYPVVSEHQVCLVENRTVLCASPKYLSDSGNISSSQDLVSKVCIASHKNSSLTFRGQAEALKIVSTNQDLLCDDETTRLALAKSGQGVVALNSLHAREELLSGELLEVLPDQLLEADRNIYLHCDSKRYAMAGVESCYKTIQQFILQCQSAKSTVAPVCSFS